MKNQAIDNPNFSIILHIRKKTNRVDIDSIYKQIIKTIDFEDVIKEFLDDRIDTLINDERAINKRNRNADSYYVNTEFTDTGALELLFPSQELSKSVPTILIPHSLNESPSCQNQTILSNRQIAPKHKFPIKWPLEKS